MKTLMVALLALLLTPAVAAAGNVEIVAGGSQPRDPVPFSFHFLHFLAGAGERNEVELRRLGPNRSALRDLGGAPTTIGRECAGTADGWVECDTSFAVVGLGDGDDLLRLAGGLGADAMGWEGDDRLYATDGWARRFDGGAGDDELIAGPGDNELVAGPGSDRVSGGDGDDRLMDHGNYVGPDGKPIRHERGERDEFDGGSGNDSISYGARTDDLTIDLGAGRGPDGDVLTSIEGAIGGEGADVLRGSGGGDVLDGGESAGDTLTGLGGDDELTGRGAGTTILAGPGDDTITGSGLDEPVSCGPGDDRIVATYLQEIAFPGRDCERIEARLFTLAKIETAAKRLRLSARATYPARSALCGLRASVRTADGGHELARAAVRIPDRGRRTVTVTARRALPARIAVALRPQRCDRRGRMSAAPAQRTLRFPLETR